MHRIEDFNPHFDEIGDQRAHIAAGVEKEPGLRR
jgi:hypothetical protein